MAITKERLEAFKQRKEEMAKKENTRVVYARTRDTQGLLAIMQAGDLAVKRVRDSMGITLSVEEASKMLEEYNNAVREYARVVVQIAEKMNVTFRAPKWILPEDYKQNQNSAKPVEETDVKPENKDSEEEVV